MLVHSVRNLSVFFQNNLKNTQFFKVALSDKNVFSFCKCHQFPVLCWAGEVGGGGGFKSENR